MSRIAPRTPLDASELEGLDPGERTNRRLEQIWAHRPQVAAARREFSRALAETGTLPPRLVELVRLRIAFHNQCRSCMAPRYEPELVDEGLVCSLERPADAPDLTDAERAALRFADLFATDHLAIDEELLDELRAFYDEGELLELGLQCARCVGFGRLAAVCGVYEDLPERFQTAGATITPW